MKVLLAALEPTATTKGFVTCSCHLNSKFKAFMETYISEQFSNLINNFTLAKSIWNNLIEKKFTKTPTNTQKTIWNITNDLQVQFHNVWKLCKSANKYEVIVQNAAWFFFVTYCTDRLRLTVLLSQKPCGLLLMCRHLWAHQSKQIINPVADWALQNAGR